MKTKKIWVSVAAAFIIAVFTGSCKKDKYVPLAGMCPIVESTSPTNLATGVARNVTITATFNEKMNPATFSQASFELSRGAIKIPGTLIYDGTSATMSFVPTATLLANTTYTGRVLPTVKDMMGNMLQTEYLWTFTTGTPIGDIIPPTVISTDPINLATGVALNKIVTATFSEPMNPLSISATSFKLQNGLTIVTGTVSYSGNTALFDPSTNLLPSTVYTATITTGARDLANNAMVSNYTWSFTTGNVTVATVPMVINTDPLNNDIGVVLSKVVAVTFSEPMDGLTISALTFKLSQSGTAVSGAISSAGSMAFFTPSSNLLPGTLYTATITTGAKNMTNVSIANDYIWSFTTANSTVTPPPFIDLKTVGRFGIIAGVGVSNNAGFSEIHDLDVGISPGVRSSVTGFPPAIVVNGTIFCSDDLTPPGTAAMLIQAKQDLTDAYLFAEGAVSPAPATVSGDLGGMTLAPGIYKSTSTLLIQGGDLTLDAQGDPNAFWVFQIASAFTTVGGAGGSVILTGGAQAKNVFWQTGSSATIGDYTSFKGTVLALTSITMNAYATATGRMLARNGAVVLTSTNIINKP